jgi:hypothetical protein
LTTIDPASDPSLLVTRAVEALPAVRRVIPAGPDLAGLVRDLRSALRMPRDGSAARVETTDDGVRVRVVVGVDGGTPATDTARAVRDAARATLLGAGLVVAEIVVRVVEIV